MSKKDLSERNICTKYINPAIERAGWEIKKQEKKDFEKAILELESEIYESA